MQGLSPPGSGAHTLLPWLVGPCAGLLYLSRVQLPSALSCQAVAVENLSPFLRRLTAQVHSAVPGGLVIWYDSVLENGALRWQNELNEQNR